MQPYIITYDLTSKLSKYIRRRGVPAGTTSVVILLCNMLGRFPGAEMIAHGYDPEIINAIEKRLRDYDILRGHDIARPVDEVEKILFNGIGNGWWIRTLKGKSGGWIYQLDPKDHYAIDWVLHSETAEREADRLLLNDHGACVGIKPKSRYTPLTVDPTRCHSTSVLRL